MNVRKEFLDIKENALKKLENAKKDDLVDSYILSLLELINDSQQYYTSSSCSGRIVLLEIPSIGDKKEAKFLGKWHKVIEPAEVLSSVENAKKGVLWLLAQSPIIHIGTDSIPAADNMVKTAVSCGFKNSGIKSLKRKIIIEVCSTERLDTPIGKDGILYCDKEHLELLIKIANDVLKRSQLKLTRFEKRLKKDLSTYKSTKIIV